MTLHPQEEVIVFGNNIIRKHLIKAGTDLRSHKHPFDHVSYLLSGEVVLRVGADEARLRAPQMVKIKAGIEHEIYAVTDCWWDCVTAFDLAKEAAEKGDVYVMDGVS